MKKILIVDPSSYSLPYDYQYIKSLYYMEGFTVEFFYSDSLETSYFKNKINQFASSSIFSISPYSKNKLLGLTNYLFLLLKIYKNKDNYSFIHFQWSIFFPFELLLFFIIKNKIIFTIHNPTPHNFNRNIKYGTLFLSLASHKNVLISESSYREFSRKYFISNKNFCIPHNILFLDTNEPLQKKLFCEYNLVFFGRVEPYKGVQHLLCKTLNELKIGIFGRINNNLHALKTSLSSKKNITVYNKFIHHEDIINLLNSKTIFILPFTSATQSATLYTLLAYNAVFISTNTGDNGHFLIKHNLKDLIFDVNIFGDILRAYEYASENYNEIASKLALISTEYNWNSMTFHSSIKKLYS